MEWIAEDIVQTHRKFWDLSDFDRQNAYESVCVSQQPVKNRRISNKDPLTLDEGKETDDDMETDNNIPTTATGNDMSITETDGDNLTTETHKMIRPQYIPPFLRL